jgi:hypothetical protein
LLPARAPGRVKYKALKSIYTVPVAARDAPEDSAVLSGFGSCGCVSRQSQVWDGECNNQNRTIKRGVCGNGS